MTTLTQRVMRTNGQRETDTARTLEVPRCQCGGTPRFEKTMYGAMVEVCDSCAYRGQMRPESTTVARRLHRAPRVKAGRPRLDPGTRRCYGKCKQTKPTAEFYTNNSTPRGFSTECRDCLKRRRAAAKSGVLT